MALSPLPLDRSALIVWDMQNAIGAMAFNRSELVPRIATLLAAYRERNLPIVFSQHTTVPERWANPAMVRSMERRGMRPGGFRLAPGTPEWQIVTELAPHPDDLVLSKTTPSFFVGTPLEALLRFRGVGALVLTGVSTEAGILGTARHAVNLGFHPIVVEDAVSSRSPEGHQAGLASLREFADIETSASLLARLPRP